jgi:hypothetical protein
VPVQFCVGIFFRNPSAGSATSSKLLSNCLHSAFDSSVDASGYRIAFETPTLSEIQASVLVGPYLVCPVVNFLLYRCDL